jgi:hypothetical protein
MAHSLPSPPQESRHPSRVRGSGGTLSSLYVRLIKDYAILENLQNNGAHLKARVHSP